MSAMRKTLSDLKRDAASGNIKFELIERFGKAGEEIPKRLRGIRAVQKVNTVAIFLVNTEGVSSELRFNSAKLVDYDGDYLTVFNPGERDLTEQEKIILDEWQRIEDEIFRKNPYMETYWRRKDYFKNCPCPWLSGYETVRGKRYNYRDKVVDNQVRGEAILKYKIYR